MCGSYVYELKKHGDAPSLGDRLDISHCATDIRSPEETPEALC